MPGTELHKTDMYCDACHPLQSLPDLGGSGVRRTAQVGQELAEQAGSQSPLAQQMCAA